jgi:RND family efflux transporter MFP subunit
MRNKLFIAVLLGGILAVALGIVGKQAVTAVQGKKLPVVAVVEAQSGSSESDILAEGTIVPGKLANVSALPTFEAQVVHVYVNNGSHVTQGQVLAELDPLDQQAALSQSLAAVQGAQAQYSLVRIPHRPEEIEQARQAVESAQANYQLVLTPHRPEEIRQMELKLESDQQAISEATERVTILRNGNRPQQVVQAEEAAKSAQANLDLAISDYAREKALYAKDLIPRAELEQSQTALTLAQNALTQAQAGLSLTREGPRAEEIKIAEATLEQAKLTYNTDQQAYAILKQGSRPEQIQEAASALRQAQLAYRILLAGSRPEQIQVAGANLQQLQIAAQHQSRLFQHHLVRSPISGVVVERNINPGEIASPGAPRSDGTAPLVNNTRSLFIIADDRTVEFMASADQRFYHNLHVGQAATVSIEAYPGRSFAGKIVRMNPLINPDRIGRGGNNNTNPTAPLTFAVWVRVPNPKRLLVPGQVGLVSASRQQQGLMIPQSALTSFSLGEGVVYVVRDGVLHTRSIQYDGNTDGDIRVLRGLKAGEKVVISDTSHLTDGMKVQVATDTAS